LNLLNLKLATISILILGATLPQLQRIVLKLQRHRPRLPWSEHPLFHQSTLHRRSQQNRLTAHRLLRIPNTLSATQERRLLRQSTRRILRYWRLLHHPAKDRRSQIPNIFSQERKMPRHRGRQGERTANKANLSQMERSTLN
jgi:hypothetical protein